MMAIVTLYAVLAGILFNGVQSLSYLEAHNKYRKIEGVPLMTYDNAIAQNAAEYAKKCLWKHSSYSSRSNISGYSYIGENLFIIWGASSVTPDKVVSSWYDEKIDYNPVDFSCTPGKMCGHYTQVIWSTSTALGCATQTCASIDVGGRVVSNAILAVCQYGPGGNYQGQSPFQRRSLKSEQGSTMTLIREIAEKLQSGTEVSHDAVGEESTMESVKEPASPPQDSRDLEFTMVL